jgi:hypothetical protein
VQLIASYYVPWSKSNAAGPESVQRGETRALRLKVEYDHLDVAIGEIVTCQVEAERIGSRGYGMMLGEIGLPPGAVVDRKSLDDAQRAGEIQSYDILPDRIVTYLWPVAGGARFSFRFAPRYRIGALTSPSRLYDYYNPDASATLAPVRFVVR